MNSGLILTMIALVAVIVMFLSGKAKFGFIGISVATFLYVTGVLSFSDAFGPIASVNVILTASMFVLAAALSKTSLVDRVRTWILNRKGGGRSIIFFYLLGTLLLTQFVSPLAVIAMLLPMMSALDENSPVQPSNLLYAGAVVAHTSQYMMPGGNGMTWFAAATARIQAGGGTEAFQVFDICKVVAIPAIVSLLYMTFIGAKRFPRNQLDASVIKEAKSSARRCTPKQEKTIFAIFIITILCIAFNKYLPISMYAICLIADLVLVALKLMDYTEVRNSINLDALFLVAGILSLAAAMNNTGAAALVADTIVKVLGGNPSPLALLIAFYVVAAVLTQIMSNTATYNVFVPLAIVTAVNRGVDPRALVVGVHLAANAAMLTPMSSPSVAIAFSAGRYKLKDTMRICLPLWIIYSIVSIIMCSLVFPVG